MLSRSQPAWSALDGNSLPPTVGVCSRNPGIFKGEAHVVRNEQIEVSVSVEVDKCASRSKPRLITQKPRRLGNIGERSVAIVPVENVLAEIRAKNIVKAIIVIVPDADAGGPSNRT